mgnify:CR=1 FL=1
MADVDSTFLRCFKRYEVTLGALISLVGGCDTGVISRESVEPVKVARCHIHTAILLRQGSLFIFPVFYHVLH